jgi:hypothetical protein
MNTYIDIPAKKTDIQSFQLLIKASDLADGFPTEFDLPIQGEAEICVKAIQVHFDTLPAIMRMEVQSPNLQFDYGNERYIQIVVPFPANNLSSGNIDYSFRTYVNGKILINIIDTATKAEPADLSFVILSGTVRKL